MENFVDYYTNKFKEDFNIPKVILDGLEEDVIEAIYTIMLKIYDSYPGLSQVICSFGSNTDINEQVNLLFNSNYKEKKNFNHFEWRDITKDNYCFLTLSLEGGISLFSRVPYFVSLSFSDLLKGKSLSEVQELFMMNCGCDLEYILYHEFGHILSNIMGLERNRSVINQIRIISNDYRNLPALISEYTAKWHDEGQIIYETLAEGFALAKCPSAVSKSNDLVRYIEKIFDEYYAKFCRRPIDINSKFDIEKRAENEISRRI